MKKLSPIRLYQYFFLSFMILPFAVFSSPLEDTQKISLSFENANFEDIFKELERRTGFVVYYAKSTLDGKSKMTIQIEDATVEMVLTKLLGGLGVRWVIQGKSIILRRKAYTFLDRLDIDTTSDRYEVIRGVVLTIGNTAVPRASVSIKNSGISTITNDSGQFELISVKKNAELVISSIGYESKIVKVSSNYLQVEVKPKVIDLKNVEIVSTGYEELNQNKITGSFEKIDNALFNRQVGSNVMDRIVNVSSGLISGPGGEHKSKIVIRGSSTLGGNPDPLIVVDNFPYQGSLESLNPNDVESVTILKDAAAAAIWGTRAGNGVIVITTKKGKFNSKLNLSLNVNYTESEKPNLFYIPSLASSDMIEFEKFQYSKGIYYRFDDISPGSRSFPVLPLSIELLLKARKSGIQDPLNDKGVLMALDEIGRQDVRSDLLKYMIRNERIQQYSMNITGGTSKLGYYASAGYDRSIGANVRSGSDRITLTWGSNFKPFEKLEIFTQIVNSRFKSKSGGSQFSSFLTGRGNSPYANLADEEGQALVIPRDLRLPYVDSISYPGLLDWHFRPLDEIWNSEEVSNSNDTRISAGLKYAILSWLKADFQYQGQFNVSDTRLVRSINSYFVRNGINGTMKIDDFGQLTYPWPYGDMVNTSNGKLNAWNVRGSLNIDKNVFWGRLYGLMGFEFRQSESDMRYGLMYGFNPNTNMYQPVDPTKLIPRRPRGNAQLEYPSNPIGFMERYGSLFTVLTYNFLDRFTLSGSARMDQSNNFGVKSNLRRVPLWSVGASWDIQEESWFKSDWIDAIKLKSSYGFTGNTITGATSFATMSYHANEYALPPRTGVTWGQIRFPNNPGLKWERVKILNLGIEALMFNGRLNSGIEFYWKRGIDLLGYIPNDPTSGFQEYNGNFATMKGKGIDFTLNSVNVKTKLFDWKTRFQFSFNKDKVLKYDYPISLNASTVLNGAFVVGSPLNALYSYRWAGLDPSNGDPQVYLGDTIAKFNQLEAATINDIYTKGSRFPQVFGSFMNTFSWNGVELSLNVLYRFKYFFRRSSVNYYFLLTDGWNSHKDYVNRWRSKGDEIRTSVPSLPESPSTFRDAAYLNSDILVERGDHIRLQDIRLSYALGKIIGRKIGLSAINLYGYVANVGILWRANKHKIDPDNYAFNRYPEARRYSIGVNVTY